MLTDEDLNHDGYLVGGALIETISSTNIEELTAACFLYGAYDALARMATNLNQTADAAYYQQQAAAFKTKFNNDWWNGSQNMWASLLIPPGDAQAMSNFWTVNFPMEEGVADDAKGQAALAKITTWTNAWGCPYQPGVSGGAAVENNICALGAFNYGWTELGWQLMKLSAVAPAESTMLGGFDGCLPSGCDDIILWSCGPYLEAIISGLVGIHPIALQHYVEIFPICLRN